MKITDAAGTTWTVTRRLSPWRRVVQPINIPIRNYARYRVTPLVPEKPSGRPRRKKNRTGEDSLLRSLVELVAELVMELVGLVWFFAVVVAWLVLLPFAFVELSAQVIVGAVLWLLRVSGVARSRVDVVARYRRTVNISSLTVLTTSGFGAAGRLAQALAEERRNATAPFDPHRGDVAAILARFGGRVERHDTALDVAERAPGADGSGVPSPAGHG
ncbi:hypothetical protein AB8O38_04790 [Saccharomonospora xinjiangensis]|uniref:hypothetical protein n=1 Tax=Saccharomonospora xinjiangensis TaxID=75294 RepID=UPI00350EEB7B